MHAQCVPNPSPKGLGMKLLSWLLAHAYFGKKVDKSGSYRDEALHITVRLKKAKDDCIW